jgi:dihydroflavonol-4-reductase
MSKQDAVLITGASGFVGSAVAHAARQRGFKVRVLVRPSSPRRNLAGLNAEVFEGDMRDEASVNRALVGARYLFHLAADYRLWARDPGEIERNNIEGTGAVMRAALQQRVERVVYTSSVATLRVNSETTAATEDALLASN